MNDTTTPFTSIADVKAANAQSSEPHWFSEATMAWFSCVIETGLYRGHWFITSEQDNHRDEPEARTYTVRYANDDGTIANVGEPFAHQTHDAALAAMWADINSR